MAEKAKKLKLSDFYTVPAAEKGKRVPLALPDGTPTEFYLVVMGADAPAARKALTDAVRALRDIPESLVAEAQNKMRDEIVTHQRCALVIGGDLPGGFSGEAVHRLLTNNTSLAARVEAVSNTPAIFYASAPGEK